MNLAPLDVIHIHQRGGSIIPLQKPGLNTQQSRKNDFELLVALDSDNSANGKLFFDDGDTIDTLKLGEYFWGKLELFERTLRMMVEHDGTPELEYISITRVVVLGMVEVVASVIVNGNTHTDWVYSDGGLFIDNLELAVNDNFEVIFL